MESIDLGLREEMKELEKLTGKMGQYFQKKEISSFVKANIEFHKVIWKVCGNIFLYKSLFDLADRTIFFGNQIFFLEDSKLDKESYLKKSYEDHQS